MPWTQENLEIAAARAALDALASLHAGLRRGDTDVSASGTRDTCLGRWFTPPHYDRRDHRPPGDLRQAHPETNEYGSALFVAPTQLEAGKPPRATKLGDVADVASLQWTADGSGITYVAAKDGVPYQRFIRQVLEEAIAARTERQKKAG